MGLDKLEEMFLFAIQSEINDNKSYTDLAERVEHSFLKTKMYFLAQEEERHKVTLEEMYRVYYPEKDIVIPPNMKGPGLNITFMNEDQLVKILETAMEYEKSAEKYYLSMADKLSDDLESSATLTYFAAMEATHYDLLKTEKEHLETNKA